MRKGRFENRTNHQKANPLIGTIPFGPFNSPKTSLMLQNIAVIAHNKMKPELVQFLQEKQDWFWGRNIIATGNTAEALDSQVRLKLQPLSPGDEGGYKELKKLVDDNVVKLVVFFRDPEIVQEYEDEVIVEFYDQQSKKRIEYKFDSWGEALETLSGIDF